MDDARRSRPERRVSRDRRAGGAAAGSPPALATSACRALRHDAVGNRPARGRQPRAADRHPDPCRGRARLRARRPPAPAHQKGETMTTTIDVEDLHTTKSEKLLALVMTVFLLIGGVWTYQRLDDTVRNHVRVGEPSGADREAIQRAERARERLF